MATLAAELDADHGGRSNGIHHADLDARIFQARPLLDVQLHETLDDAEVAPLCLVRVGLSHAALGQVVCSAVNKDE